MIPIRSEVDGMYSFSAAADVNTHVRGGNLWRAVLVLRKEEKKESRCVVALLHPASTLMTSLRLLRRALSEPALNINNSIKKTKILDAWSEFRDVDNWNTSQSMYTHLKMDRDKIV
jgi:hypothetical protein